MREDINLKFEKVSPRDCDKCILSVGCGACAWLDSTKPLFNFDCEEDDCHIEFKRKFVPCTKENTKVGDTVYRKDGTYESGVVAYIPNDEKIIVSTCGCNVDCGIILY